MKDSIHRARAELNSLQFSTNDQKVDDELQLYADEIFEFCDLSDLARQKLLSQAEPMRPEEPQEFSSEHAFCVYALGQRLGINLQLNERASYGGELIIRKKETGSWPGLLVL